MKPQGALRNPKEPKDIKKDLGTKVVPKAVLATLAAKNQSN